MVRKKWGQGSGKPGRYQPGDRNGDPYSPSPPSVALLHVSGMELDPLTCDVSCSVSLLCCHCCQLFRFKILKTSPSKRSCKCRKWCLNGPLKKKKLVCKWHFQSVSIHQWPDRYVQMIMLDAQKDEQPSKKRPACRCLGAAYHWFKGYWATPHHD